MNHLMESLLKADPEELITLIRLRFLNRIVLSVPSAQLT